MPQRFRRCIRTVYQLFCPPKCAGCGERLPLLETEGDFLCPYCRTALEQARSAYRATRRVTDCAVPSAASDTPTKCAAHICLFHYRPEDPQGVPQKLIYTLKHGCGRKTAEGLGALLARSVQVWLLPHGFSTADTVFTYPPRRAAAVRREGIDQAELLAKSAAAAIGCSCVTLFSRTRRGGGGQKKRNAAERRQRAAVTYALRPEAVPAVKGKTVVLTDDLCTTGATLEALTAAALSAGAVRVLWATVGQTVLHTETNTEA